uniref:Uncharacterized protein n=1 Tax=Setaria digitata TaxID=48799 RepID=A0A915PSR7_9BILA
MKRIQIYILGVGRGPNLFSPRRNVSLRDLGLLEEFRKGEEKRTVRGKVLNSKSASVRRGMMTVRKDRSAVDAASEQPRRLDRFGSHCRCVCWCVFFGRWRGGTSRVENCRLQQRTCGGTWQQREANT